MISAVGSSTMMYSSLGSAPNVLQVNNPQIAIVQSLINISLTPFVPYSCIINRCIQGNFGI